MQTELSISRCVNVSHLGQSIRSFAMLLPAQYFWFEPVLFAALIVFSVDLVGNILFFGSRVVNAMTTAVLFAALFGSLIYYGYGNVSVTFNTTPSATAPAKAR
jgi:hypothetical protein